jgi:nucleotide-binding universal stress UspA family protein
MFMSIICYDGSEDAQAAADQATRLFRETPATVLTVWGPDTEMRMNSELGLGSGFGVGYNRINDTAHLDALLLDQAQRTAEEGAHRLRAAGMGAESRVEQRDGSIAKTVLAVAERVNAEAVVVGTRGRNAAKSALLGSVSHALVQHADRPVVVIPSAALARDHEGWLLHRGGGAESRV